MGAAREPILVIHWRERSDAVRELLHPFRGRLLVDVGCGQGLDAHRYRTEFREYVGLDVEPRGSWRPLAANGLRFAVGDAERTPLRDGAADAVLALWLAEHLALPERFFREVHRILRPGGGLVLLTPNRLNYNGALISILPRPVKAALKRFLVDGEEEHVTYYRCNTVRRIDEFASRARLVRKDLRMLLYPGYSFRLPFGVTWFRIERAVLNRLKQLRPAILASYEKQAVASV